MAIARGKHPFPSRTRQLRPAAPKVLLLLSSGRLGRRQNTLPSLSTVVEGLAAFLGIRCRILAHTLLVFRFIVMPSVIPLTTFHLGPGALGTELQRRGLALSMAPEGWNLHHADEVAQVHTAYAAAGATWLVTNTFGASRPRLEASGLSACVWEINRRAAELARSAPGGLPVIASVGPTGAGSPHVWEAAYAEQVEHLAQGGVDGFLVETIVHCHEGTAAVRAARAVGAGLVVASFTPGPEGALLDGSSPEEAAEAWLAAGADVVGANCGTGPESILAAARRLVTMSVAPVYAAPSAGLPLIEAGVPRYNLTPDAFADAAIQLREAGVLLVAGCCGITPEHIRVAVHRLAPGA